MWFRQGLRQAYVPANASGCDSFCVSVSVPYCFLSKVIRKSILGAPDPAVLLFPDCFLLKVMRKSLLGAPDPALSFFLTVSH